MLLGIVFSGAYDTRERVVLERNVPKQGRLARYEFLGMRQEDPVDKPAMEIRVSEPRGAFLARPRMYADPKSGRSYADPHIQRSVLGDLYVEPVSYQPPVLELARGESVFRFGYRILFEDFELERHDPGETGEVVIRARLHVEHGDEHAVVSPRLQLGAGGSHSDPAALPGGMEIRLVRVLADRRAIVLRFDRTVPEGERGEAPPPEIFVADVSRKPLIGLLWIGVGLVGGGGLFAGVERLRET
jgi:hypothetical protein